MSPRVKSDAREKIIAAAYDLFYRQGYQATPMDEIIAQSGYSKPTVYSYFPTKESLCVAYLQERRRQEGGLLAGALRGAGDAEERFLGIAEFVRKNMMATKFRGCGFFNLVAEIPDRENPIVGEAMVYIGEVREVIREATEALKASDPKYAGMDVERVSQTYYVIICGAIMGCQEFHESWPLDRAVEEVERLLASAAA